MILGPLAATDRDVLVILAGNGPMNGNEVYEHLSDAYDDGLGRARVYQSLNRLASRHLVDVSKSSEDRRAKEYRATTAAAAAVVDYLQWARTHTGNPEEALRPAEV